jgi:glucuronoarabinoxylan endo-1,4-beta-xylanase
MPIDNHSSARKRVALTAIGSLFAVAFAPIAAQAQESITLNSTSQTIDGFGASSAWSGTMSSAQAATFFGTGSGQLGLTLWRVRIDPGGNNSAEAANAAYAHNYGAKVLATPWTPPASYKSNDNTIGGTLKTSEYAAYASYLDSSANTLGVDYVSVQNEPDANVNYESCSWTGAELETFCQNNANSIGHSVVMPESQSFNTSYSDPTLNNSTADSHITYIAGHLYGTNPFTYSNALSHNKHVWMTEHYYNGTDIGTCMTIAKEINDCMDNQMSAYIWWYAFFSGAGCDIVNGSSALLNGDVIGQYAKYVRRGYVRVNATYNPVGSVYVSAYTGGGHAVVVAVNTATSSQSTKFTFSGGTVTELSPVVQTDASESLKTISNIAVSGDTFTTTLPAQSVTTFVGN